MEKEGILFSLKLQNTEIPTALLAGLIVVGIILLILALRLLHPNPKTISKNLWISLKKKKKNLEKEKREYIKSKNS